MEMIFAFCENPSIRLELQILNFCSSAVGKLEVLQNLKQLSYKARDSPNFELLEQSWSLRFSSRDSLKSCDWEAEDYKQPQQCRRKGEIDCSFNYRRWSVRETMNWQLPKIERIECIHESSIGFISEIRLKALLVISWAPLDPLMGSIECLRWSLQFGVSNV